VRALLVNPSYPETYWSLEHMLPFVSRDWLVPPLGLITIAALLPRHWECRLVDLAIESISDQDVLSTDVVMLTGMLVQRRSLHAVIERCRRLGVRTVVGGPYATAMPEALECADHLVLGEAEEIVPVLAADLEAGRAHRVYRETRKPALGLSPLPRFDLLKPNAYHYLAVQFSRGCPFRCEFCDVISLYGRRPRTKAPARLIAELEAILATGFKGRLMVVDDNFIADKKAVRELLPELATWRRQTCAPVDFFTQVSIDLADEPALVDGMTKAGFAVVFIGIETPCEESLRETRKTQNLNRDVLQQVRRLGHQGLDVWGGFVLGFDRDGPEIFDRMIRFVQDAGIAYAMVGMLTALPNTPLHARLAREGRLLPDAETGDGFAFSNVVTRLPMQSMVEGYIRVLEALYDPEIYFERCREHLRHWRSVPGLAGRTSPGDLLVLWRSIRAQGLTGTYRRAYWQFLAWALRHYPNKLSLAVAQACAGHHFITYTRDAVVPALRAELSSQLDAEVALQARSAPCD